MTSTLLYTTRYNHLQYTDNKRRTLGVDSIQPDVIDVGDERTFSLQNFSMFPWE